MMFDLTEFTPRRRINLSLPDPEPEPWPLGIEAATLTARVDQDLDAVVIHVPAAGVKLLLSRLAARAGPRDRHAVAAGRAMIAPTPMGPAVPGGRLDRMDEGERLIRELQRRGWTFGRIAAAIAVDRALGLEQEEEPS